MRVHSGQLSGLETVKAYQYQSNARNLIWFKFAVGEFREAVRGLVVH